MSLAKQINTCSIILKWYKFQHYLPKQVEEEGGPEKGERPLGWDRSWEFLSSSEGSFLPRTLGCSILCIFHPQNKLSPHQSLTFGLTLYKFIVMGPVWKPRPYRLYFLWFIYIGLFVFYTKLTHLAKKF